MATSTENQGSVAVSSCSDFPRADEAAAATEIEAKADSEAGADSLISLTISLPDSKAPKIQMMVSSQEQVHEIRQSIIELPAAFRYTCFHFEFYGRKINDYIPLAEIPDLDSSPVFHLVQDPYTEKEARIHFVRIRELIGAAGNRTDISQGVLPGLSLFETLSLESGADAAVADRLAVKGYDFEAIPPLASLIPEPTGSVLKRKI
ncbi:hypothetical protein CDD83_11178 [Cordyceps sp. RAO-2017]|nr:hypothetical protein CDD83_11178 [Cordyceps sp. RAO-2017]